MNQNHRNNSQTNHWEEEGYRYSIWTLNRNIAHWKWEEIVAQHTLDVENRNAMQSIDSETDRDILNNPKIG